MFLQPPIFGAYLYDAVYQYAIALNKTIAMKQQVTGTAVVNKLKDIQYNSKKSVLNGLFNLTILKSVGNLINSNL